MVQVPEKNVLGGLHYGFRRPVRSIKCLWYAELSNLAVREVNYPVLIGDVFKKTGLVRSNLIIRDWQNL
jgi:hypothetical protein